MCPHFVQFEVFLRQSHVLEWYIEFSVRSIESCTDSKYTDTQCVRMSVCGYKLRVSFNNVIICIQQNTTNSHLYVLSTHSFTSVSLAPMAETQLMTLNCSSKEHSRQYAAQNHRHWICISETKFKVNIKRLIVYAFSFILRNSFFWLFEVSSMW